jgi:hypothetical protein
MISVERAFDSTKSSLLISKISTTSHCSRDGEDRVVDADSE